MINKFQMLQIFISVIKKSKKFWTKIKTRGRNRIQYMYFNAQLCFVKLRSTTFYYYSLPVGILHSLLTELLRVTMEISPEAAKYTDLHFDVMSGEAIFAAQLYHRWYALCISCLTVGRKKKQKKWCILIMLSVL